MLYEAEYACVLASTSTGSSSGGVSQDSNTLTC
jgi:hypothetical protein